MGANKLNLPTHKVLVSDLDETSELMTGIVAAGCTGKKPLIRIPPSIVTTMRNLPKAAAWFTKNAKAYNAFVEATNTAANPAATRTKGAGG
jgi:hypothetical protein